LIVWIKFYTMNPGSINFVRRAKHLLAGVTMSSHKLLLGIATPLVVISGFAHATDYTVTSSSNQIGVASTDLQLQAGDKVYVNSSGSTTQALYSDAGGNLYDLTGSSSALNFRINGNFTDTSGTIKTFLTGNGIQTGSTPTMANIAGFTINVATDPTSTNAAVVSLTNTTVNVSGSTLGLYSVGARWVLVSGQGGIGANTATVSNVTATTSNLFAHFMVVRSDDGTYGGTTDDSSVYLVLDSKSSVKSVATGTQNKAVGAAVDNLSSSTNTGALTLYNAVQNLSTATSVNAALKSLAPNSSQQLATTVGANTMTNAYMNTISSRANSVRLGTAAKAPSGKSGLSSGDASGETKHGISVWAQGFGGVGTQDSRSGVDGFDVNTYGGAVGADMQVFKHWRIGTAFAYGRTTVDPTGTSTGDQVRINTYQGALYANYTAKRWYLDTTAIYGLHQYDETRKVNFTGYNQTTDGKFNGNQITGQVVAGMPIKWRHIWFTPNLTTVYTNLKQDAYTETNGAGSDLSVNSRNNDSLRTGVGLKITKSWVSQHNKLTPELHGTWFHEYLSTSAIQTARFASGGTSFTETGVAPEKNSYVTGLGLSWERNNRFVLSVNYDAEVRDSYLGHAGTLEFRYKL